MQRVRIQPHGAAHPIDVEIERVDTRERETFRIAWKDAQADIQMDGLADGEGILRIHGCVVPFCVSARDGEVQVWIAGRTYHFTQESRTPQRATSSSADTTSRGDLKAPMPGTVLMIKVKPGEEFQAHQPLVVMDSMKMEMTLSVPHAGRVKEITCKAGQLVDMGAILVKLVPSV